MTLLRIKRKERGLTLQEVARAVGVAISNLSRVERAQQSPSSAVALRLYRFYNQEIPLELILNVPTADQERAA